MVQFFPKLGQDSPAIYVYNSTQLHLTSKILNDFNWLPNL